MPAAHLNHHSSQATFVSSFLAAFLAAFLASFFAAFLAAFLPFFLPPFFLPFPFFLPPFFFLCFFWAAFFAFSSALYCSATCLRALSTSFVVSLLPVLQSRKVASSFLQKNSFSGFSSPMLAM